MQNVVGYLMVVTMSVATMSYAQLSDLAPYTQFARAAYCPPAILLDWACGRMYSLSLYTPALSPPPEACQAVPGFQVSLAGGDGNAVQFCNRISSPPLSDLTTPLQTMSDTGLLQTLSSSHTRAPTPHSCSPCFPSCMPFAHPLIAFPISPTPTSSWKAAILPSFPA